MHFPNILVAFVTVCHHQGQPTVAWQSMAVVAVHARVQHMAVSQDSLPRTNRHRSLTVYPVRNSSRLPHRCRTSERNSSTHWVLHRPAVPP